MALRTQLEAGDVDTAEVRRRLAELARALLARHPRDAELKHVTRSLAARDFVPAPPATLPRGTVREVRHALLRRSADELASLAATLVVVPDAASEPEAALAALELFVLVPGEEARAQALAMALEGRGHDVSLARFALALRSLDATRPESFEAALAEVSTTHRAEAERRAATRVLGALAATTPASARAKPGPKAPYGLQWMVPCRDGTSIANHVLAFARRPALRTELGVVAAWIENHDPILEAAQSADRQAQGPADWARATTHFEQALDGDDRVRVLAARSNLLLGGSWAPAANAAELALPRSALAQRLESLARMSADAQPDGLDAGALELIGDRRAAAHLWFELATRDRATAAFAHATRLATELRAAERRALADRLRTAALVDETALGADPDLRIRAELLNTLEPDPWTPFRLAHATPRKASVEPVAETPTVPESDPHHPDNRLAAASDLLAAGKLEPASNILAALVRKVDEHAPARLFTVVAQALEAEDEPSTDLVHAAQRALTDARRCPALLAALLKAPTAAFTLHEELIAFALDPSRNDVDRLAALEVWLGIWRATETPPDADAIRTLRESEPALLVAAALRLAGHAAPLAALARFLEAYPARTTEPEVFSAALLATSLGRS